MSIQKKIIKIDKKSLNLVEYKNDPVVNFYIRKELNLLKILTSIFGYTFFCIGFSFFIFKNTFKSPIVDTKEYAKKLSQLDSTISKHFEKQLAFQNGQRGYFDQKILDLANKKESSPSKKNWKNKYESLKEMKLDEWRGLIDKPLPYSRHNVMVVRKAQKIQVDDFKFKLARKEKELLSLLDLSKESDIKIYETFRKKTKFQVYQLRKNHDARIDEFRKKGVYVSNSSN